MRNLLADAHAEVLARFAWSNVLVGLDFDGTLAPIVDDPAAARMRASTRALLARVAASYPVAIVSGRARADVRRRLDGVRVNEVVGNHGLEPGGDIARCREVVARWVPELRRRLADLPGVEIEDKTYSVAVHYRRSRTRRAAHAAIRAAVAALGPGTRSLGGKLVVNVIPIGAPHKGIAMVRLRRELAADTVLYVGDDITDEDVFGFDDPGRLLGVRVGRSRASRADYYIPTQRSMDTLLARLIALRSDVSSPRHVEGECATR